MKFKVGDRVKCIESISTYHNGPEAGEIFIVTSVNGSYIGFPLERLRSHKVYQLSTINGTTPNWGVGNFELCPDISILGELGD